MQKEKWKYCMPGGAWPSTITEEQTHYPEETPTEGRFCAGSMLAWPETTNIFLMLVSHHYSLPNSS